jgi:hypothetical protein
VDIHQLDGRNLENLHHQIDQEPAKPISPGLSLLSSRSSRARDIGRMENRNLMIWANLAADGVGEKIRDFS